VRSIPPALAAHLTGDVTTLAVCWRVARPDGVLILGTEHDSDLTVSTGDYAGTYSFRAGITGSSVTSTADVAVDNLEVAGALDRGDLMVVDLSAADIEAGLFDGATVTLFLVNWQAPDDGQLVLRTGTIGAISRTAEGEYKTELRGLTQKLTQNFIRTFGSSCDAELGDTRCGVDITLFTLSGTVVSVSSNRQFIATLAEGSPVHEAGLFNGGLLTWVTGNNASYSMEVRRETTDSPPAIQLYLPMSLDIQVGDTFTIAPGCDKSAAMCKGRFDNLVSYRGHGSWVPGAGELMVFGGQTAERKPNSSDFLAWPRP
jgi:uncharacterized phage protein (TIGR02218 family)